MATTIEPLRPIIHRQISVNYCSPNSRYVCHASFLRNSRSNGAIYQNPGRFRPEFRVLYEFYPNNLWGGFAKQRKLGGIVRVRANGSCEHDKDSTDKTEAKATETRNKPSGTGSGTGSSRRERQGKGNWWWSKGNNKWRWQPIIQAQEIGVLLLQLGIVMFVMRLLRPGIPLPGSEPRPPTSFVSVPYSEFLTKINGNRVQKVEVDGVHIMFKLKESELGGVESEMMHSKLQESESLLRSVNPTKRIIYTTTRPTDIKTPYEKMLENDVQFGSPDKRSGGFMNSALVSFFAVFL